VAAGDGGLNTDGKEERFVLRLLGSGVCNRTHFQSSFVYRLTHTTEVYVVACRNAEESPDVARAVATKRALIENGMNPLPKRVTNRLEEQIKKHYERPPVKTAKYELPLYNCRVPKIVKVP
jgi:hypothetical protein